MSNIRKLAEFIAAREWSLAAQEEFDAAGTLRAKFLLLWAGMMKRTVCVHSGLA